MTLVAAALYVILCRHVLPNGAIPVAMVLAGVPFIGFCLIAGISLVSGSEGWSVAATAVVNSSYWIAWYALVTYSPSLTRTWTGAVAVWNASAIRVLGPEFAVILIVLLLTMFLQSRKRDFI